MKSLFKKIRYWFDDGMSWWKKNTISSLEASINEYQVYKKERTEFFDANYPIVCTELREKGWNILSEDRGNTQMSFKIQRGDSIHTVSIEEALRIK